MKTSRGPGSSLSWSYDGRFIARANGNEITVADASNEFMDIATDKRNGLVRCVSFCKVEGKRDLLAVVGLDGHLTIYRLTHIIRGTYRLKTVHSSFVEKYLWVVAWSIGKSCRRHLLVLPLDHGYFIVLLPLKKGGHVHQTNLLIPCSM